MDESLKLIEFLLFTPKQPGTQTLEINISKTAECDRGVSKTAVCV